MAERTNIVGMDHAELEAALKGASIGADQAPMRARQVWHWVYHRGARDFASMTTLAKDLRSRLDERFTVTRPAIAEERVSADGARKWLLDFADGNQAECVFIPEEDRGALCVSSQVGCTLNCTFCHTGTQKLVRNLSPGEIVGQVLVARDSVDEWPVPKGGRLLSNIVVMGMGEPFYNYDNVAKALRIIMDGDGIAISKRRITMSTSGVVPMIRRCGEDLGVKLAISLHATTDSLRDELVPINRKYPIAELLQACRDYPGVANSRRITFEYVMLKGINDSAADARHLVRLIKGIHAKFNLIPFNPWPGAPYECSSAKTMKRFAQILNEAGLAAPIRAPRGRDILAACGQLRSASVRRRQAPAAAPATAPTIVGEA